MSVDRAVFAFVGSLILISVLLSLYVSPLFVWLTVFVGVNLIQAAFTRFCPAAWIFSKMGLKAGCAFRGAQ
ncbi:YgaP family membrane protein [Paenirhodobacter sp.]|uniref:YgaP family membrane protein n=1 Tax=Paenirhodobacter sp. TaxID=1965326 RepID=UPI003B3DF772